MAAYYSRVRHLLSALVETFGKTLMVKDKEIGQYLRNLNIQPQSGSLPFKSMESGIFLIILAHIQDISPQDIIHLGYWIGTSDVPSIPTILVGDPERIPTVMKNCLNNLFCVKESNIESVLKPLAAAFTGSKELIEQASKLPLQDRTNLRTKLVSETLKAMEDSDYDIEALKSKL